ncbi:MAG: hypothetical protein D6768_05050, partial [Chloroflexi bacterium]
NSFERVEVSEPVRRWLCYFAAGDPSRPLPRLPVDWEALFQAVGRNGILGLAYHILRRQPDELWPPPEFRDWVRQAHRQSVIRMALMQRRVTAALADLQESGLDFLVIKGPVLAQQVYPDSNLRPFGDLDIVVRERDWPAVHRHLLARGFVPEAEWPEPPPKLHPKLVLYELKYWHPGTELLVEVHYDDLLNAGLASRDGAGFWQRAGWVEIEGVRVKALSAADQLLHLCMHAHYHGYTRLNWLSDIALLVRDHAEKINWPQFVAAVEAEEAEVGVYFTFCYMEQLLGVAVPADVLAAVTPDAFRRRWHERFQPEAEVLSLAPMWRADFSFYFLPLRKRLLPDLLVMGRRREKLAILLRLFAPPATWLRYYYRVPPERATWPHYVLHPLKILTHYTAEILSAMTPGK